MKTFFKYGLLLLAFYLVSPVQVQSQVLLSGDANNDGIVNNLDILYIGYAFGNVGPAQVRSDSTDGPIVSEAVLLWDNDFPDEESTNYLYSDSDGDGFIDEQDFLSVSTNYNRSNGTDNSTDFPQGILGIDPQLGFNTPIINFPLTAGSELEIPIFLGDDFIPVESLNGIAFSVAFDSLAIEEVRLDFSESWANPNEDLFSFQIPSNTNENQHDAAITRYSSNPISGSGQIGTLSIVIEGNLIEFFENTRDSAATILKLDKILAVDGEFGTIPIVGDSIQFMIYHPQTVSTSSSLWQQNVKVYPTPAQDILIIESPFAILQIQCYNAMGQLVDVSTMQRSESEIEIHCNHLVTGNYVIQMLTEKGIVTRKFVVQEK